MRFFLFQENYLSSQVAIIYFRKKGISETALYYKTKTDFFNLYIKNGVHNITEQGGIMCEPVLVWIAN